MVLKTTRWSPDTCGCEVLYTWDTDDPEANRTHTLSEYTKVCTVHQPLPDDTTRWNTILDENPRKNLTLKYILDNGPTGLFDIVDGSRQLKNGISYSWSWSGVAPDRVLTVTLTGINLTTQQRNTIQTALNNFFGVGKVVLA